MATQQIGHDDTSSFLYPREIPPLLVPVFSEPHCDFLALLPDTQNINAGRQTQCIPAEQFSVGNRRQSAVGQHPPVYGINGNAHRFGEATQETDSLGRTVVYVKDQKQHPFAAVFNFDDDNKLNRISMQLTADTEVEADQVWSNLLESPRDYKLGTFYGAKFINGQTGEGGLKQTPEETLGLLDPSHSTMIYSIFGIARGVYCCPVMDYDLFHVEICRNYFPLRFNTIGKYLNRNIDEVLNENYEITNKLQFGTALAYLYFNSAIDNKGNSYTMNFDSDASLTTIKEISIYIPDSDESKLIAQWKDMILNSEEYLLGTPIKYYVTDAFGNELQPLATPQDAIDLYEVNGRANGIIAQYESENSINSLILNKDYAYVMVRAK